MYESKVDKRSIYVNLDQGLTVKNLLNFLLFKLGSSRCTTRRLMGRHLATYEYHLIHQACSYEHTTYAQKVGIIGAVSSPCICMAINVLFMHD